MRVRGFHGTAQAFETFAANPRGIFFAEDPDLALSYIGVHAGPEPRLIEAELDIRNPWQFISYGDGVPYRDRVDQTPSSLVLSRYDGIRMPHGVWIVFSPDQIRLVRSQSLIEIEAAQDAGVDRRERLRG